MASQGPNTAASAATGTGGAPVVWTNPDNARVSDGSNATCTLTGQVSQYLSVSDLGFTIPAGATVNGFVLTIIRSASGFGVVKDEEVKIGDSATSANRADTSTAWPDLAGTVTYGSSSDLWGQTWTPGNVNGAGTSYLLSARETGLMFSRTAQVDSMTVTVYYTPAAFPGDEDEGLRFQVREVRW